MISDGFLDFLRGAWRGFGECPAGSRGPPGGRRSDPGCCGASPGDPWRALGGPTSLGDPVSSGPCERARTPDPCIRLPPGPS